jgi:transposase
LCEKFLLELSQDGTVAKGFENIEIPRENITLRQLYDKMKKEGIDADERQLRRACKQLGIELTPDRRGRPKGKRGKSRDPK